MGKFKVIADNTVINITTTSKDNPLSEIIASNLVYATNQQNEILFVCNESDFIEKLLSTFNAALTNFSIVFPNETSVQVEKIPSITSLSFLHPMWKWNISILKDNCFMHNQLDEKHFLDGVYLLVSTIEESIKSQVKDIPIAGIKSCVS